MMDRRHGLKTLLAGTGAAVATSQGSALAQAPSQLQLKTPSEQFKTRIKVIGSLANEPVYTFMRLNVFGDPHNGNFLPMFTMNNLLIDHWEKTGEDEYVMTKFEAAYFTEFDSDNPIETWDNPFTGETIEIFNFQLGPVQREYRPGEVTAMAYAPTFVPIEVIGERVFVASHSIDEGANFFTADEYPIEASGSPVSYLNSFMTWSANVEDVANPEIMSAPAHVQIQNKVPWAPWMRMRGRPGGTSLRGFGAKISGLDALPDHVIAGFETYVPDILKENQWEEMIFETTHYLQYLEEKKAAENK
ncbi:MAG: DUF1838 family protein [Pseudomonadota bacterium]